MLKNRRIELALMNAKSNQHECVLLYSHAEIKAFLEVAYRYDDCTIKSTVMDGQRVFIIKFDNPNEYDDLLARAPSFADASPTLLGCIPFDLITVRNETLESMRGYLETIESGQVNPFISVRRNDTYHHPKAR